MDDLIQIMRREAMGVVRQFQQGSGTLVATAYNPKTHAIKGMFVPSEVESGWIPLAVMQAGDGFGVMAAPNIGSAEKLDGDVFNVSFEGGNGNVGVAHHTHFSASDNPPEVKSGEILIKHQTGGSTLMKADGSIVTTHKDGGQSSWDADGNHTLDTKGKNVTISSGEGSQTFTAKSQSFTADNIAIKGKVALDGDLSSTGKVAGLGGVTSAGQPVRTT